MRRNRRARQQGEVELNLAAMLDMAFQLLAFFILTFRPSPVEGQIVLRLPPPSPVFDAAAKERAGENTSNDNPVVGLETLTISVFSNDQGRIDTLNVGTVTVRGVAGLASRLKEILTDEASPFEQVIVQAGSKLRYEELMSVVDVCTRQKLANGEPLSKLSFMELPDAPDAN
ncbi:MAG TPA: biopolymer transporter ExbD [Pirellulales bacterium]|jgi:biopolymer transport protein ExbD|nr:biopolymer transporter ExbD [Pirellulales bacterium]